MLRFSFKTITLRIIINKQNLFDETKKEQKRENDRTLICKSNQILHGNGKRKTAPVTIHQMESIDEATVCIHIYLKLWWIVKTSSLFV